MRRVFLTSLGIFLIAMMTACNGNGESGQTMDTDAAFIDLNSASDTESEIETKSENSENVLSDDKDKEDGIAEKDVSSGSLTSEDGADKASEPESETITYEIEECEEMVLVAKKAVNIRTLPNSSSEKMGTLKKGDTITVNGNYESAWYRVEYEDGIGYVSLPYLIEQEEFNKLIVSEEAESIQAKEEVPSETVSETTEPISEENKEDGSNERLQVVDLMNQQRSAAGIANITESLELTLAAQKRAEEIVNSFSHTRPNGSSCFTVLNEYSVTYMAAGENIAAGQQTPEEVMNAWMNSEGHKENILSPSFGRVGIGICRCENGYGVYWVQLFAD